MAEHPRTAAVVASHRATDAAPATLWAGRVPDVTDAPKGTNPPQAESNWPTLTADVGGLAGLRGQDMSGQGMLIGLYIKFIFSVFFSHDTKTLVGAV